MEDALAVNPRRIILRVAYPVLKRIGKWHSPWTHKLIVSRDVDYARRMMKPGDIFLTRAYGEATNLCIPGHWKHAALVINEVTIIEACDPVVRLNGIYDFMMSKDQICLIRPRLPEATRGQAAGYAMTLVGKPYDYYFEINHRTPNESFYCAELPYWCYVRTIPSFRFVLKKTLGVLTVKPDDYYLATKFFDVIWKSG